MENPIDKQMICPHCNMGNCYETQYEDISVYLCFNCGYTTNSKMIKGKLKTKENLAVEEGKEGER